jgi:hypothetical protein
VVASLARFDAAILGLLEGSLVSDAGPLLRQILKFLGSGEVPTLALFGLLQTASVTYDPVDLERLRLDALRDRAAASLTKELRAKVRAEGDWSVPSPGKCSCELCAELATFLANRSRKVYEWPLSKDKRAHVHGLLDAHELPVTHVTVRRGSPHTLVLTKTHALFDREAKDRASKRAALDWLSRGASASRLKPAPTRAQRRPTSTRPHARTVRRASCPNSSP